MISFKYFPPYLEVFYGEGVLKNNTALKLPKIDFWSKFQLFISNRSRVIEDERNVPEKGRKEVMDGQIKINRLAFTFSCASLKTDY